MEFHDGIAARTLWGEARGEGAVGMNAVAHVILNRLNTGRWGRTVAEVCLAPFQFSAWNDRDPNRPKMLGLSDAELRLALTAWHSALADVDPTFSATHYKVIGTDAHWAIGQEPCVRIGMHEFFNTVR